MHQAGQGRNDAGQAGNGHTGSCRSFHVGDIFDDSGGFFLVICLPSDGHPMF